MVLSIFEFGWSWLPSELFSEIFDRLSIVDRIRCRCVCRSWRCAAQKKPILHPPPPESPWLMFRDPVIKGCNFYSIAENRIYRMNDASLLPGQDFSRRSWIGSSEGWLITADERSELHLLNPISRVQIPLPSILSLPRVTAVRDPEGRLTSYRFSFDVRLDLERQWIDFSLEETRDYLFCHGKGMVKWWTDDSNMASWTVMLLFSPGPKLAYATSGDNVWTTMEGRYYGDLLLYDGLFYILHISFNYTLDVSDYSIKVWDTAATGHPYLVRTITLEFEEPDYDVTLYPYLVVSSSHIFLVRRDRQTVEDEDMYRTLRFEVYLLDHNDGGALKWARVHSLEDKAIFIGINSCICLSTRDFPQLRRNCIYFADDHWEGALDTREETRDIGVCCLEDGAMAPCYPEDIPKLNWPPPLWITPNLL